MDYLKSYSKDFMYSLINFTILIGGIRHPDDIYKQLTKHTIKKMEGERSLTGIIGKRGKIGKRVILNI